MKISLTLFTAFVMLIFISIGQCTVASKSHRRNFPTSKRSYIIDTYPRNLGRLGMIDPKNTLTMEQDRQEARLSPYSLKEECRINPDPGPCAKGLIRWFYNYQTSVCNVFIYGGCDGNNNRFDTYKKCMERCYPLKNLVRGK